MTAVQILLLIIVGYLCLYALIHRICTCVENCAMAKAYGKGVTNIVNTTMEEKKEK